MESNVLSWNQALADGREPSLYLYESKEVPLGEYKARLDFKIWAKRTMGISCYFTQQDTGIKLQLTVYRRHSDELYKLEGGSIDFKTCPISSLYDIKVELNGRGNTAFRHAAIPQAL